MIQRLIGFGIWLIVLIGCNTIDSPDLVLVAEEADGIAIGDNVFLHGVKVGTIEKFGFTEKDNFVCIDIALDESMALPENSYALLKQDILGKGKINILPSDSVLDNPYGDDTLIVLRPKLNIKNISDKIDEFIKGLDSNSIKFNDIQIDYQQDSLKYQFSIVINKKV